MQYPRKVYCIDTGLINAIIPKFSENIGNFYENIVAVELRRKNKEIYYWKNENGEVDFIVKDGLKIKELIQVCYDIKDEKTKKREIKSLMDASKELKCNNLIVITDDYGKEENIDNKRIKYITLWEWLLR